MSTAETSTAKRIDHKRVVASAGKAYDKTTAAVFALAAHGQMRFSECLALAPEDLKNRHAAARSALVEAEACAIAAGKAWRASFGMLTWYR